MELVTGGEMLERLKALQKYSEADAADTVRKSLRCCIQGAGHIAACACVYVCLRPPPVYVYN